MVWISAHPTVSKLLSMTYHTPSDDSTDSTCKCDRARSIDLICTIRCIQRLLDRFVNAKVDTRAKSVAKEVQSEPSVET